MPNEPTLHARFLRLRASSSLASAALVALLGAGLAPGLGAPSGERQHGERGARVELGGEPSRPGLEVAAEAPALPTTRPPQAAASRPLAPALDEARLGSRRPGDPREELVRSADAAAIRPARVERGAGQRSGLDAGALELSRLPSPRGEALVMTLARSPRGLGALRVVLALGESEALVDPAGLIAEWRRDERAALPTRLALLRAHDAEGRALAARFETDEEGVALVVEDEGASYPLTLSASLESSRATLWGGQQDAFFGVAVAGGGDLDGDGTDDLVVGAYQHDNGEAEEGRAYAYLGSAAGLDPAPAWQDEGQRAGAFFGRRALIVGDVDGDGRDDVVIGATGDDTNAAGEGRIALYLGAEGGLEPAPAWERFGGQASAGYGYALAPAGDVDGDGRADLLVGTPRFDGLAVDGGRVELFLGSESGLADAPAWSHEGALAGELLGGAVSAGSDVDGDGTFDLVVGAQGFSADGLTSQGRALVFRGLEGGYESSPIWEARGGQDSALFGYAAAGVGDVDGDGYGDVLVGAQLHDVAGLEGENHGRLALYRGGPAGPEATPSFLVEGTEAGARLGVAVAGVGDVNRDGLPDFMASAFLHDGDFTDEGRAWLWLGRPGGAREAPAARVAGGRLDAWLGFSISAAGDVNADGRPDVALGAHNDGDAHSREGRALVLYGPLLDEPPALGATLSVVKSGADVLLSWSEPTPEPGEGPVAFYLVRRDTSPKGAFPSVASTRETSYVEPNAAEDAGTPFVAWLVDAENEGPMP